MYTRICQRVTTFTKSPLVQTHYQRGAFRLSTSLAQVREFVPQLSEVDRIHFERVVTASIENNNMDKRSITIKLENPIEVEGRTVRALRFKGVFPQVEEDPFKVKRYDEGNGFCKLLTDQVQATKIQARMQREADEFSAAGTLNINRLGTEAMTALELGMNITDILLGFGVYDGLIYADSHVGFVVYGLEREEDHRLHTQIVRNIKHFGIFNNAWQGEAEEDYFYLAEESGLLLRQMHDMGMIHRYPHLGNYARAAMRSLKIVDLDTRMDLSSIPPENRLAFLYLDVARVMEDYYKDYDYKEEFDGEIEVDRVYLNRLLPRFLWGYFKQDESLPFVQEMKQLFEKTTYQLFRPFGYLPEFGVGFREHGTAFLVEPVVRLYASTPGTVVDLAGVAKQFPVFQSFLDALNQTHDLDIQVAI